MRNKTFTAACAFCGPATSFYKGCKCVFILMSIHILIGMITNKLLQFIGVWRMRFDVHKNVKKKKDIHSTFFPSKKQTVRLRQINLQ